MKKNNKIVVFNSDPDILRIYKVFDKDDVLDEIIFEWDKLDGDDVYAIDNKYYYNNEDYIIRCYLDEYNEILSSFEELLTDNNINFEIIQ